MTGTADNRPTGRAEEARGSCPRGRVPHILIDPDGHRTMYRAQRSDAEQQP